MKHLDLFSGIGGFALAAKWAGFETVQFVENDKFCQRVLQKNFPGIPIHDDIKTFHWDSQIDLITGGIPCQPFSNAGKKRGRNDNRYLWHEMYRVIRRCKPAWIIIENVVGIVAMELDHILFDLEKEGYETGVLILPACAANAPHRRDRVWIIANAMQFRRDHGINYWQSRSIPKNKEWNMEALHAEWEKWKPEPWKMYTASNWLHYNACIRRTHNGLSPRMDKDRIKALGNAIVPQTVYPFMKFIIECEKLIKET